MKYFPNSFSLLAMEKMHTLKAILMTFSHSWTYSLYSYFFSSIKISGFYEFLLDFYENSDFYESWVDRTSIKHFFYSLSVSLFLSKLRLPSEVVWDWFSFLVPKGTPKDSFKEITFTDENSHVVIFYKFCFITERFIMSLFSADPID